MFTGIIEATSELVNINSIGTGLSLTFRSILTPEFHIDQSVSHDGVCLTITSIQENDYTVVAIKETLEKTTIGHWKVGKVVNLERAMRADARLDGHFVQGHVDGILECQNIMDNDGSWTFYFNYQNEQAKLLVYKGSICINGVSLTISHLDDRQFGVSIIPYTFEHTNFKHLSKGDQVNIEFDILGKYISRHLSLTNSEPPVSVFK